MQENGQAPRVHEALRQSEPDVRPLGFLAIGFALVSLMMVAWYFWNPLAWLAVASAVILGFIARGDKATRAMGNVALVIAGAAILWPPCAALFWY